MRDYQAILGKTLLVAFIAASTAEAKDGNATSDISYMRYSSSIDKWQENTLPVQGLINCLDVGISYYLKQTEDNAYNYKRLNDRDVTFQCLNDHHDVVQQVYYYWTIDTETQEPELHRNFFYPMPSR